MRVWIFAQDKAFPAGLTLKFGVFITRSELIQALYERGPFSQWGKPLFFVMMLFALMLSVMLYAIFEGFVDDAAVAYLGASTAFYIFCQQARTIMPEASLLENWQLFLLASLNLFAAICTHTFATLRVKAWAVVSIFIVFLICNWGICFELVPQDPNYLASHQPIHTYYFAQLLRLPIIFGFIGIGNLLQKAYTADGVNKFVFIRRILFEQIPFSVCLFAYFNTFSELAEKRKMGIETELFSTSLVEIFFFVFAINFLNKFIGSFLIKQNSSSASESDMVAQNLPQVVRKHWEASNWDIILIDLDIGGFTLATKHLRSHTQDLVEKLGYGLRQLTSSADLEWLFAGTVGDQWLVALKTLSKKRPIDELRSVVSILQESSWKLDEVVDFFAKSFNVDLSLHINCYLLQDATLGGPLRKAYDVKELERLLIELFPKGDDGKFKKEPELHCEGLNFLLKFSHKTAHDEILVAGPQHLLAEWTELTQSSFATHATSKDASIKHAQRLRELDMKYGIVKRMTSAKKNKAG